MFDTIIEKLKENKEVYLHNDFYETAIRVLPNETDYFAKAKGTGKEYPIKRSTDLVCETLSEAVQMTKDDYEKY